MTVVAYIMSWTPKVMRKARSRYFVVKAVMINPKPRPNKAIIKTRIGKSST